MTLVSLNMAYRSFRGGSGRLGHPPRYAAFNQSSSPRFQLSSRIGAAELDTTGLSSSKASLGPLADQPPFFLGKRSVDVEHEGIGVSAQLGDDEGDALSHQSGNEMHVAAEAVELGHDNRAL